MIRSAVFGLSLLFCFSTTSFAVEQKDPLPDYAQQFSETDALLRNLDSTTHITNAYTWMSQAIEAKIELDAEKEIKPWLTELAESFPHNWRVQCAVARGFWQIPSRDWEEEQWQIIQPMDRAYALLMKDEETSDEEKFYFYNDYISVLCPYYEEESYYLLLKTPGVPYEDWRKQCVELEEYYATNALERLQFFDLPRSYTDAANDGELLRQLIKELSELENDSREVLTMADYSVMVSGVHINMPEYRNKFTDEYEPPPSVREIAFNLADYETVVWGENTNEYRIVKLPEDYQYIPAFERLAEQGDLQAAENLGIIFSNRSQMERAAQWYELAGCTNEVHEIRANQGVLLPHSSFMYEDPVKVDYYFRNGSEVELELYPIKAGQNLLQRLITDQVMESEINLLLGDPNDFLEFYPTNYARPARRTNHPLDPAAFTPAGPPRHRTDHQYSRAASGKLSSAHRHERRQPERNRSPHLRYRSLSRSLFR